MCMKIIKKDYDKTGELPFDKKILDITLSAKTLNKLKEIKKKTGKSIFLIIEEKIKDFNV